MYSCPFSHQLTNSMPSLNVPCVCRRKSFSSIFSSLLNSAIAGIVASPTPTMPISDDSTSVIVSRGPSTLASAAAVIHPAVPPPAMTTDLISVLGTALASQGSYPLGKAPAGINRRGPTFAEESLEAVTQRQRIHRAVLFILDEVVRVDSDIAQQEPLVGEVRTRQGDAETVQCATLE